MKNIIIVHLFIDSNCDLCKTMQHELMNNPPNAEVKVTHVSRGEMYIGRAIKSFPTTRIYTYPYPYTIAEFEGFVSTEDINAKIKEHETKFTL